MKGRRYEIGRAAVFRWFLAPGVPTMQERIDVVTADVVDHYIEEAKAPFYPMPYGAHRCPELGRVLGQMHRDTYLARHSCGLQGMAGMGFPRWVYSYYINPRADRALVEKWLQIILDNV